MTVLLEPHLLLWVVLGLPRVDEVSLMALVTHALSLTWTRDPVDRLLAAHSAARRSPLCTLNRRMRQEHRFLVPELA